MTSMPSTLKRLYSYFGSRWFIGRLIGFSAPYSGNIGAHVLALGDGYAHLLMPDRRRVRNHLNSIHACAMATLAETSVGLSVMYSLPTTARGIATRLSVDFHKKARGPIEAECRWTVPDLTSSSEMDIVVEMRNSEHILVATGTVRFRFGPT
jgi:uncharacterized protein (TIGR00369 family)